MEVWERHGCLLVDECKVSKTKEFDKNIMEFVGFIDLGRHNPHEMENRLGDHALVIILLKMFSNVRYSLSHRVIFGTKTNQLSN